MLFIDICGHLINFQHIIYIEFVPECISISFTNGKNFHILLDTEENKKNPLSALIVSKEKFKNIENNLRNMEKDAFIYMQDHQEMEGN